jgi:hypothetical protein
MSRESNTATTSLSPATEEKEKGSILNQDYISRDEVMSDSLTAAEQRCLKLVTIAEEQAKDAQRELHKELATVRRQLHDQEELCQTSLDQLSRQMEIVVTDLRRTTDYFRQAHQEATKAILASSDQRSAQEAVAISSFRTNLHMFHKYTTFMRRRTLRNAFFKTIRHCSPLARKVAADAMDALIATNHVAHAAYARTGLEMTNLLHAPHQFQRNQRRESGGIPDDAAEGWDITFEQFCEAYQNFRAADQTTRLASRSLLTWSPTPGDRQLLDHLLLGPVRRTALAVGNDLLDSHDDDDGGVSSAGGDGHEDGNGGPLAPEDVVAVFQSVLVYLCGATDLLDRLSSTLESMLLQYFCRFETFTKGTLLSEERAILQKHASSLMKEQVVEIVPRSVTVLLTQKIADSCEERFTFAVEKLRGLQRELTDSARTTIGEVNKNLIKSTLRMLLQSFSVTDDRAVGEKALRSSQQLSAGEAHLAASSQAEDEFFGLTVTESAGVKILADLRELLKTSTTLGQRLLMRVQAQFTEAAQQSMLAFAMEIRAFQREAQAHRQLSIEQKVTVFRLPQLQSDIANQQALKNMMTEKLRISEEKASARIFQLEEEIASLRHMLSRKEKSLADAAGERLAAVKEAAMLHSMTKESGQIRNVVLRASEELRIINYTVSSATFGDGWQRSLLVLREQLHKQNAVVHSQILAEVATVLRRRNATFHAVEQMLDARLAQILRSVNDDIRRREQLAVARNRLELDAVRDEHAVELQAVRDKCQKDLEEAEERYKAAYNTKLAEMNELYESRVRKMQQRQLELESLFEVKIRQQREKFRVRENELEERLENRFKDLHKIFESELNTVKKQFTEKERKLDRDRLLIEANIEKRVNERVSDHRKATDRICQQLQTLTLSFVRQKQEQLESFRDTELTHFNDFLRDSLNTARKRYNELEEQLLRVTGERIRDAELSFEKALNAVHEQHRAERQAAEHTAAERTMRQKQQQEEVLRMTQLLRIEQDESFWQSCFARLVAGEKTMQQKWTEVRLELQRRYSSVIDTCTEYLNRDIAGARRAFESEVNIRTTHLHRYVQYYHQIQLRLEEHIWEELLGRSYTERAEATEFASMRLYDVEQRLRSGANKRIEALRDPPIESITVDDLRRVRDKYETRLLDQQLVTSQLQRECIASLDIGLRSTSEQARLFQEVALQKMSLTQQLLKDKADAFHESRLKVTSECLAQLLMTSESSLYESKNAEDTSFFKTVLDSSRKEKQQYRLDASDPPTPNRGVAHHRQEIVSPAKSDGRGSPKKRRAHSAGPSLSSGPARTRGVASESADPRISRAPLTDVTSLRQQQTLSELPKSVTVSNEASLAPVDWLARIQYNDPQMVQYFTSIGALISTSADRFQRHVEQKFLQYEKRRKELFRQVHEEYVEASSCLMQRLDSLHGEKAAVEGLMVQQSALLTAHQAETSMCVKLLQEGFGPLARQSLPQLPRAVADEIASLRERVLVDEWQGGTKVVIDSLLPSTSRAYAAAPQRQTPLEELAAYSPGSDPVMPSPADIAPSGRASPAAVSASREPSPRSGATPGRRSRSKVVLKRPSTRTTTPTGALMPGTVVRL